MQTPQTPKHCTAACFLAFCCRNNAVFERTFMPRPDVVCMHAAAGSCKKCHAAGCVNKTRARELKSSARFKTKAARQSMQGGPCNQAQSIPVASGFLVGLTPKHAGYSHGDRGARASTVMRFRATMHCLHKTWTNGTTQPGGTAHTCQVQSRGSLQQLAGCMGGTPKHWCYQLRVQQTT